MLRQYINLGTVQSEEQQEPTVLTSQITGQIDWRRDGIRHRKNEVGKQTWQACTTDGGTESKGGACGRVLGHGGGVREHRLMQQADRQDCLPHLAPACTPLTNH